MESLNISLSSAVQRRVSKARNAMSKETYKLQRSFTAFLVAQVCCLALFLLYIQATIPFISITTPCMIYVIAFFADWKDIYQSTVTEIIAITIIVSYPLLNCICCFVLIRPYKMFLIYLVQRLFLRLFSQHTDVDRATLFSFSTSTNTNMMINSSKISKNKHWSFLI